MDKQDLDLITGETKGTTYKGEGQETKRKVRDKTILGVSDKIREFHGDSEEDWDLIKEEVGGG